MIIIATILLFLGIFSFARAVWEFYLTYKMIDDVIAFDMFFD